MNEIKDNYIAVLKKYTVFDGRATRSEYWHFTLVSFVIYLILSLIGLGALGGLYSLAILLPGLGVSIRRLHDIDKSGFWVLVGFIPLIGWIILLYFATVDSQPGSNQYGPNPKEGMSSAAPAPEAEPAQPAQETTPAPESNPEHTQAPTDQM